MKKIKEGFFVWENVPDNMKIHVVCGKKGYGKTYHELNKLEVEKRELSLKIQKAKKWLYSDHSEDNTVDSMTLFLLDIQIKAMLTYMESLEARICYMRIKE